MRSIGFVLVLLSVCLCAGWASSQDFFIWDPDPNHSSANSIKVALELNGYIGDYDSTTTPDVSSLTDYCAIFICLGQFPWKYVLPAGEVVDSLVSYLDSGGNIYMEGGDTWFLDPATALHPYFNINALADGYYDLDVISGQPFQFTQGMVFDYTGENIRVDRLAADPGAVPVFQNGPDSVYYCGISYSSGTYKTVGVSFEFGGLVDGSSPSTKAELALAMMNQYFGCPPPTLDWDVSVLSIDDPDWWVCPNDDVEPKATVKGFGDSTATNFDVTCEIFDSLGAQIYSQFVTVISLPKDSSQQVSFPTWAVGEKGNYYQVTVYTQLAGDQRTENDTLSMATTTVVPFGTVMGSNTFPAVGTLGGITYCGLDGYFYFVSTQDDQVYRLDPDDWSYSPAFATDNAASEVPYGISWDGTYFWVGHLEESAVNYFYNRQYEYTGTPTGIYVDMAGVAGQWWAGMDFDNKYTRQATVGGNSGIYRLDLYQEWGILDVDFITGPWSIFSNRACGYIPYTHQVLTGGTDTLYLVNATAGLTVDQARIPGLLAGIADAQLYDQGPCNVDCAYALLTIADINKTMVKVGLDLTQAVNDYAAISVDSPGDSIAQDSTVMVGTVANWGTQDQNDVWVFCSAQHEDSILPEFEDSTQVSLLSCEQGQANFPNKWLPGATGCYRVRITTFLMGDENFYNNDKTKKVCVTAGPTIHDGGVVAINAPPDTVYVDTTYIPQAVVQNFGNVLEDSFNVECLITPGYADTQQVVGLGPGVPTVVTFANWIPSDTITYHMCVTTFVTGDSDPGNDSLCKDIFVRGVTYHDGSVVSIDVPMDTVCNDSTYTPSVTVTNFGNVTETFDVTLVIPQAAYAETTLVIDLAPNDSTQVPFPDWIVPSVPDSFWYPMTACAVVAGDTGSANDCVTDSVFGYDCAVGIYEGWKQAALPTVFALGQSSPNPFDQRTVIHYQIPAEAEVSLKVYDLTGRLVKTLIDRTQEPGYYTVIWDGRGQNGTQVSSGIYFYRLSASGGETINSSATRILTVLR